MKTPHPGWTLTQPTGVFHFCHAPVRNPRGLVYGLRLAMLIGLASGLCACQPGPETFARQVDEAAARGLPGLLPLLTRDSRAAVQALSQSRGEGANPFLPPATLGPTTVLGTRATDQGLVMQVSASGKSGESRKSEWVLRQEDGAWRLDLLATANRRPLP